jgi:hypothetical protein
VRNFRPMKNHPHLKIAILLFHNLTGKPSDRTVIIGCFVWAPSWKMAPSLGNSQRHCSKLITSCEHVFFVYYLPLTFSTDTVLAGGLIADKLVA